MSCVCFITFDQWLPYTWKKLRNKSIDLIENLGFLWSCKRTVDAEKEIKMNTEKKYEMMRNEMIVT